jgi:hypothetical protein
MKGKKRKLLQQQNQKLKHQNKKIIKTEEMLRRNKYKMIEKIDS